MKKTNSFGSVYKYNVIKYLKDIYENYFYFQKNKAGLGFYIKIDLLKTEDLKYVEKLILKMRNLKWIDNAYFTIKTDGQLYENTCYLSGIIKFKKEYIPLNKISIITKRINKIIDIWGK